MYDGFVKYSLGAGVEAFTTMRDSTLPYRVVCGRQVHGNKVAVIDDASLEREDLDGYDALVTNLPVAIGVRTADCIPILLYDPVRRVVAAIHSGWKGTVQKIIFNAVSVMAARFGSSTSDMLAVVGPGIGFDNFQVGEEVPQFFKEAGFPLDLVWRWEGVPEAGSMKGGHHIDLKSANIWLLENAGLRPSNIQCSNICTYADTRFFSARREGYDCGRNINFIRLK